MTPPSVWQIVLILVIVLLLFGGKKIPELAKGLGSGIKNFKKAVKDDENDKADSEESQAVNPSIKQTTAQTNTDTPKQDQKQEA